MTSRLTLTPGMPIPYGGDKASLVPAALAEAFTAGDRLLIDQETGALLHVPRAIHEIVAEAVDRAAAAFESMAAIDGAAISDFFDRFAALLATEGVWSMIAAANAADVEAAKASGRSTTRLAVGEAMRGEMIAGLRVWRDSPSPRHRPLERIDHDGWNVEQISAPLGVVGFVFEGRPNVFADAVGVLRGGNTVVFRIGSDALGTARAIAGEALAPALAAAGLPPGAACLIDSADRAAGWTLFRDRRLSLAVARGSGAAVAQLGAVARQAGTPVSAHGTGGAWLVADASAEADRFALAVENSLDRKVCNTLNVCCIVRDRARELVPVFVEALRRAGQRRGQGARLHVVEGDERWLPGGWLGAKVQVRRAEGDRVEPRADTIAIDDLAVEWEWEETPEVSLKIVADLAEAMALFNRLSPRFIACLIASDPRAQARFQAGVEAAFVGDGFTRWVDGQYAFGRPELGLSNWQGGRLLARGAVLAGDGVFTVRTRMRQGDPALRR
ncbi:MAG TPA: aldehyde dehydrogenase family protein [Caulobacteraceae bacterium]|nr:aldehyde dehydrogenase family protein [Caulobacteraceae bacterium]